MYKVVIIDDEPVIVEGLMKTIPWAQLECQVAGCAYDGKEGREVIGRENPNLIITDISMPQMNGLTMIAGIRSEYPDTRIAVLTGFRDFDYAQQAIKLGVDRFLLKPSKMDELEEAVSYMTGKLKKHKIYPEGNLVSSPEAVSESAASNFIVKNALEYIEEHYQEKLRLNDVADCIYVSQWHLSKLLNKQTGKNFSEILNGVRIKKAKELLQNPSRRIGDVAEEVGFMDMAHFSRVFKSHEGMSANEYRNQVH